MHSSGLHTVRCCGHYYMSVLWGSIPTPFTETLFTETSPFHKDFPFTWTPFIETPFTKTVPTPFTETPLMNRMTDTHFSKHYLPLQSVMRRYPWGIQQLVSTHSNCNTSLHEKLHLSTGQRALFCFKWTNLKCVVLFLLLENSLSHEPHGNFRPM